MFLDQPCRLVQHAGQPALQAAGALLEPLRGGAELRAQHLPAARFVEQLQPARDNGMVRIVVVGGRHQFWTTGLPNLENLGIARFAIYRRDGHSRRFEYVAGIRRPEDTAAQREAAEHGG